MTFGSLSKLTRRSRGGGREANFYSEGLKAKWIHSARDIIHSLIERKFKCDRLLSAAASVCLSSLLMRMGAFMKQKQLCITKNEGKQSILSRLLNISQVSFKRLRSRQGFWVRSLIRSEKIYSSMRMSVKDRWSQIPMTLTFMFLYLFGAMMMEVMIAWILHSEE